jgi:hypothetical protein
MYAPKRTQDSNSKNGSKSEAQNYWKTLHESRTLDQFYYHSLENTTQRDEDQVVTRYINKIKKETPLNSNGETAILRVDQVWLWVIDDSTLLDTCS